MGTVYAVYGGSGDGGLREETGFPNICLANMYSAAVICQLLGDPWGAESVSYPDGAQR